MALSGGGCGVWPSSFDPFGFLSNSDDDEVPSDEEAEDARRRIDDWQVSGANVVAHIKQQSLARQQDDDTNKGTTVSWRSRSPGNTTRQLLSAYQNVEVPITSPPPPSPAQARLANLCAGTGNQTSHTASIEVGNLLVSTISATETDARHVGTPNQTPESSSSRAYRYDTTSAIATVDSHTSSAVSLTPAIALDSGIPHVAKLERTSSIPSTAPSSSTDDSAAYPQDGEKSVTKEANSLQIKRARFLSPKKRRRNIILCSSLVLLIGIVIIVVLTTIGKDSSTVSGPNNVGSDGSGGDGTNVTTSNPPPVITSSPSASPDTTPAAEPTASPASTEDDSTEHDKPKITYQPGLLVKEENGMVLSQGLKSRFLAKTGQLVQYANGSNSTIPFHIRPDGAATFRVPDSFGENKGGWVYVSNSEGKEEGTGGVNAVTFDKNGNVIGFQNLLKKTTMNCSGGKTPWGTWVSCEEWAGTGQVYQVDPFGRRPPQKTTVGIMQGGRYEAFAYDDRDKKQPVFYVTEDQRNGPTRRFRPNPSVVDWNNDPWNMLHGEGKLDYLVLDPDASNGNKTGTYEWVESVHQARRNAFITYPSAEGIDRKDNLLYMACKREKMLYVIDLDSNKYVRYSLEIALFDGEPDGVTRLVNDTNEFLYFNEDLGDVSGVHARNSDGQMFTILEGPGWSNEVTGLTFSPSGMHMYLCFQEDGVMFEITREDGLPFYAATLNVRYHNKPVQSLWTRH